MSMLAIKLLAAAGVLVALSGGTYAWRTSVYNEGVRDGIETAHKAIEALAADAKRKNATIVKGDQELIVAKTVDKEKIVTIYRTIREQLDAQIIEVPVYRDIACSVPGISLQLIAQAAAGGLVPADPQGAARAAAPDAAGAKK